MQKHATWAAAATANRAGQVSHSPARPNTSHHASTVPPKIKSASTQPESKNTEANSSSTSQSNDVQRRMEPRSQVNNCMSPLIVSLRMNEEALSKLTSIRRANFPRKQNNLDAHITILHALPSELRKEAEQVLASIAGKSPVFNLSLGALRVRPRIILLPARAKQLDDLVYHIQEQFWESLSDQDRQDFRGGHITLCNKHDEEETARRAAKIEAAVADRRAWNSKAMGLDLWIYRGNKPWENIAYYPFKGAH